MHCSYSSRASPEDSQNDEKSPNSLDKNPLLVEGNTTALVFKAQKKDNFDKFEKLANLHKIHSAALNVPVTAEVHKTDGKKIFPINKFKSAEWKH